MIVESYLEWAASAPAHLRADAAGALARSCLYGELEPQIRADVVSALTYSLEDPHVSVRCAIAQAFASSSAAPHAIVSSLAQDAPEVAEPVLMRSPLLSDAELIDLVALGGARAELAVACRPAVSPGLSAAIAEVAGPAACAALAANPGARLLASALARIAERHGADGEVRDALFARPDVGPEVRQILMRSVAGALVTFVAGCGWLGPDRARRAADDACDRGALALAGRARDAQSFVIHLVARGEFTASLALRAVLCGDVGLFEAALAALSGQNAARVAGFVRDFRGRGFEALYLQAGFPRSALGIFRAALAARREAGPAVPNGSGATLSRRIVDRALAACDDRDPDLAPLRALLRRFATEAAREEARRSFGAPPVAAAA